MGAIWKHICRAVAVGQLHPVFLIVLIVAGGGTFWEAVDNFVLACSTHPPFRLLPVGQLAQSFTRRVQRSMLLELKPTYQSGTNHTPVDSISLVLDFTSCLLERGENPFGEALVEKKGTWLESFVFFFFHCCCVIYCHSKFLWSKLLGYTT